MRSDGLRADPQEGKEQDARSTEELLRRAVGALTCLGEVGNVMARVGAWLIANDALIANSPETATIAADAAAIAAKLERHVASVFAGLDSSSVESANSDPGSRGVSWLT